MKKLILSVLCLATMWSCNTQDPENGKVDAGNTYMKFSLKMETKSGTTDNGGSDAAPGTEVGMDTENYISSVDVVLQDTDGNCVVADNVTPDQASTDTYVASFNTLDLVAGATYNVYIYANCDAPLTGKQLELDATSEETVANMTKEKMFWMTNANNATNEPHTLPSDLSLYTLPQNPWNIGTYNVERSMARFDFMPTNNNQYNIMKDDGQVTASITLTEAALINQSKSHYMLRRVSADGTNTDWEVGGTEISANYVVDTDYAAKAAGYAENLAENFTAHLTTPDDWTWKSIAVADLTQKDNWDGTAAGTTGSNSSHNLNEYYIWQYAKENTIPQDSEKGNKNQQNGISTGIVFKGQITGTAVEAANGEMIFVFENVLYGNWAAVEAAASVADAPATLVAAVNKITSENKNYAAAGFTGYSPDKDGKYYAYYYYWNRHNDNGDNSEMGQMEFAVVRNNVYKLCVDKIAKFGHPTPGSTDPDPDPVDPTDPNEELDYYFTVTVKVLPWVVRVNHIEF